MKVIEKIKKEETTPTSTTTTKYRSPSSVAKPRNVTVNRYNEEEREANPFTNKNNYKSNNHNRLNSTTKKKANEVVSPSSTLMKTKK
jgi:uncharacterized protein YcbK (DUF882 family)